MNICFNPHVRHQIVEANSNFYASPFKHPGRKMDTHDFIYMIDGEWKFSQNGKAYTMQNDSILILSANQWHEGISFCRPKTKTMYFHVSADPGYLTPLPENSEKIGLHSFTNVSHNNKFKKIFWDIVNSKLNNHEKKASILFDLLICELEEYYEQQTLNSVGERAKAIIHQHPEKFFSNQDLAKHIGISLKALETKFKEQFGITIHQYMLHFKIQQAKTELTNFQKMPIREIAYNLGFYDEYHFSKQFKKLTGVTPKQYRHGFK